MRHIDKQMLNGLKQMSKGTKGQVHKNTQCQYACKNWKIEPL